MRWPWQREQRESSFTDSLVALIQAQAGATRIAAPSATAALEAASGCYQRAFQVAEVTGAANMIGDLTPYLMGVLARELIRVGDVVLYIEVHGGRVRLRLCSDYDVTGAADPERWRYRLNLSGPSRLTTINGVGAESVIHLRYTSSAARPWRGIGPVQAALIGGQLSAEVGQALADEAAGIRGNVLPIPKDPDDTVEDLTAKLKALRGSTALVESTAAGWGGDDMRTAPKHDWRPERLGANPPASLVELHKVATAEILASCGVPIELIELAPGTAQRESFRRFLHGSVAPLGRIVEHELQQKVDPGIRIGWAELRASDVAGRARAFQSLTGAGLTTEQAARITGIELDDQVDD